MAALPKTIYHIADRAKDARRLCDFTAVEQKVKLTLYCYSANEGVYLKPSVFAKVCEGLQTLYINARLFGPLRACPNSLMLKYINADNVSCTTVVEPVFELPQEWEASDVDGAYGGLSFGDDPPMAWVQGFCDYMNGKNADKEKSKSSPSNSSSAASTTISSSSSAGNSSAAASTTLSASASSSSANSSAAASATLSASSSPLAK